MATGKPLWQGEGGSLDYNSGAPEVIRAVVRGYTDASLTAYMNWPLIAALYPNLPYKSDGLIWADEPWSGWYSVGATTWVLAQVTQFTQPGWTFIDSASGHLNGNEQNGTFVTLKSPNGSDYSTILETTTGTAAQSVNFTVTGGLCTGTIHVWATNLGSSSSSDWFVQQPDITPSGGVYSLSMQPDFVYSITTISGQGKGATTSPAAADLSLPYSDSLAGYPIGSSATYLAQLQGDFQSQPCFSKGGNCIMQMLNEAPSVFFYSNMGLSWAALGDVNWSNYAVSVDAPLEQSGTVYLAGLVNANGGTNSGSFPDYFDGYSLQISDTGAWILYDSSAANPPTALASGSTCAPGLNTWFTLAMTLNGSSISASINGNQVASVNNSDHQSGQVGFGILGWQTDQCSNLSITPGPCTSTTITPYIQVSGQSWQQTSSVTVSSGYTVNLGPQFLGIGSWIWNGPNGFTSTSREIDAIPLSTGVNTFVTTYTNAGGCQSTQTFTITVTGNPGGYWLSAGTAAPASVNPPPAVRPRFRSP